MIENNIILRKRRDFGQVISDTFAFLKENFKEIMRQYIAIVGTMYLVLVIIGILAGTLIASMIPTVSDGIDPDNLGVVFAAAIPAIFILVLLAMLMNASSSIICFSFMRQYVEVGKDQITLSETWREVTTKLFPVIFGSILWSFMIMIGVLFLFIPGLILMIIYTAYVPCMILDRKGVFEAFEKVFTLFTTETWFLTLGILLVVGLIVGMINNMVLMPLMMFGMMFTSFLGLDPESAGPIFIVALMGGYYIFAIGIGLVLSTVTQISIGIQYYNLAERVDATGTKQIIDQIGENEQ